VLSTAVAASTASAAWAMPPAGMYVGGEVDKYYGASAFLNNLGTAIDDVLNNLSVTVFVDEEGNAASMNTVLAADKLNKALRPAVRNLFEENDYRIVGGEGAWNPENDPDLGEPVSDAFDGTPQGKSLQIGSTYAYQIKAALKADTDQEDFASISVKADGETIENMSWDIEKDELVISFASAEEFDFIELEITKTDNKTYKAAVFMSN
jgi:hypothetical protein